MASPQQLAPQQKRVTIQYGGHSAKRPPLLTRLTYLVAKSTMLRSFSSSFFRNPILTRPLLEAPFLQSVPHHKSNPTLWQCGSAGPLFFQLRSRGPPLPPRHPADPQIKVARPIVARFETKAITSPDYRCALSFSKLSVICFALASLLTSPPFRLSPTPDCRAHPFGIKAKSIGLSTNFQTYCKTLPLTCNAPPPQ